MSAWRRYDVRGTMSDVLDAAGQLCQVLADAERPNPLTVFIGSDGTAEGDRLQRVFESSILPMKARIAVAPATTPAVVWLAQFYDLTISCSASHDAEDGLGGFKVADRHGVWRAYEYGTLREGLWPRPFTAGQSYAAIDGREDVAAYVRSLPTDPINRRVMVVAGSMPAMSVARKAFEQAGCLVTHHVVHGLDPANVPTDFEEPVGINVPVFLFDGDGDRVGLMYPAGRIWQPSEIMLAALGCLTERSRVLVDMRCPKVILQRIAIAGHKVSFGESGRAMNGLGNGARIGGRSRLGIETSLHFYWPERGGNDDGLYTALRLAQRLDNLTEYVERPPARLEEPEEIVVDDPDDLWASLVDLLASNGWDLRYECAEGQRWEMGNNFITHRTAADGRQKLHFEGPEARTLVRAIYA